MKLSILLLFILGSTFHTNIYAQSNYDRAKIDAQRTGLKTGVQRLELLTEAAVMMENPTLIQPIGDPASSVSLDMHAVTEMLGASELAANEMLANASSENIVLKCNDEESLEQAKTNGTLQLYSQACIIFELINSITDLITESDSLEKQNVEAKASLNQAKAEDAKRKDDIEKEKKKMQENNKLLKKAIDDLKKAKEAQKKAQEAVEKATKALEAANAIQCGEDDDGSCASAKASAVEAATKALDAAKKELEKANKALEKATAKMVNLLVNKLGIETSAVLAMLNGTIRGETEGGDVHFQVGQSDFTLVNLGKVISETTGAPGDRVEQFIGGEAEEGTETYFDRLIGNYDRAQESGNEERPNGGGYMDSNSHYLGIMAPHGEDALREVIDVFVSQEGGLENLETIAMAVQDYQDQRAESQTKLAEAMKTPQGRSDEIQRKIEERTSMIANIKKMLAQNMEFLEKSLKIFKELFALTQKETLQIAAPQGGPGMPQPEVKTASNNPFYIFISQFSTEKLKKKIAEGYSSEINYLAIQAAFKCYAEGGDGQSCKVTDDKPPVAQKPKTCHWSSGFVIGGSAPRPQPTSACSTQGEKTTYQDHEWTCQCQN